MLATHKSNEAPVSRLEVSVYSVPTDSPESDGTLEWHATEVLVVEIEAAGATGLGYSYAGQAAAALIASKLVQPIKDRDAMEVASAWEAMYQAVRNTGQPGVAATAISAIDVALWDLKSRLLDLPVADLLGRVRKRVPIYGSGGFTSYSDKQLYKQLAGWVEQGIPRVKMKVGREPERDLVRVQTARKAIGPNAELFVDANGALRRKQALALAVQFAESAGVSWFEEPVSSDDLEGLRLLRDRGPAGMDIAAGEYGFNLFYFERMLEAGAVDVLQADATRCGGFTGFMAVGPLCQARCLPLSAHTAPALHVHPCCALTPVCHVEYFHDHVRIEQMFFDGVPEPVDGTLAPDLSRPGHGLDFKRADAEPFLVWRHDGD